MANLFAEKLELCVSEQMENGLDKVNAKEMGEVVDMIKDSYEIEKLKAEKKYYDSVVNAMHEHEEDVYDRYGYPVRRDNMGRYMSPRKYTSGGTRGFEYRDNYAHRPEDMTRDMYWDENGMREKTSRYGYSHDEYMEKRKDYTMTDPRGSKKEKTVIE